MLLGFILISTKEYISKRGMELEILFFKYNLCPFIYTQLNFDYKLRGDPVFLFTQFRLQNVINTCWILPPAN